MSERIRLDIATRQIEFSRKYMLSLVADIDPADWVRMPNGAATHVAWQVAHLAMAEYGLCLYRVRGRRAEDVALMPSEFRKQFSKGTIPNPDPKSNPPSTVIVDVLNRVHEQTLKELSEYTDEQLDSSVDEPHSVFPTKLGAIYFCSAHEMLHAGQIGLLRRLFGKQPLR